MSRCQTRKLWSFMHMVHSEDKPQHRTNWHSFTWTGLRPTDQPQNCKQAQHWTMGERTAGRGEGLSDNQRKKASQQTEDKLKGSPQKKTKKIRQRCRTTTEIDKEEVEEAAELWRLQETSARQKKITEKRERVKQWLQDNMESWATPCKEATVREMGGIKKAKRNWGYTNRTDDSPQPTNTARVQLPHTLTASLQPKKQHGTSLMLI